MIIIEKKTVKINREKDCVRMVVCGDNQTIKLSGKDSNNELLIIEQYDKPGIGIPMHIHRNEDETFHILEGEMEVTVGDKTTILKKGDIAYCPRNIPHSWKTIGIGMTRSILTIYPSKIEEMFSELSQLTDFPPNFDHIAKIAKKHDIYFL